MKKALCLLSLFFAACLALNYHPYAYGGVTVIGEGNHPQISGNKIACAKVLPNNGGQAIVLYHLGLDGLPHTHDTGEGEFEIARSSFVYAPRIYENKIIWVYNNYNIYLYDLGPDTLFGTDDDIPTTQITNGYVLFPEIHGNKIVWEDIRNNNDWDIYMYDLKSQEETLLTPNNAGTQVNPNIYENKIVWQDWGVNNSSLEHVVYNLGNDGQFGTGDPGEGEFRIVSTVFPTYPPVLALDENQIVWSDARDNHGSLLIYDAGPDNQFGTIDDLGG